MTLELPGRKLLGGFFVFGGGDGMLLRALPLGALLNALVFPALADVEDNLSKVLEAARKLEFAVPDNRAFLLVNNETIRTEIAVVFGYVDNWAACEQIAKILTESGTAGTFSCDAVR